MYLKKIFHCSRLLLFDAWTKKQHLQQWWGPYGFTNTIEQLETFTGGRFSITMQSRDGMRFPVDGIYHELHYPSKLVFSTYAFKDNIGNVFENLNTVLLVQLEGKVELLYESVVTRSSGEMDEALKGIEEGWKQSFHKLDQYLATITQKK